MTVDVGRETSPLPLRRRRWLAFLDCGAAADELPLLSPMHSTAAYSASDIPRAFVAQDNRRGIVNDEIVGALRALNPRPSSAIGAKDRALNPRPSSAIGAKDRALNPRPSSAIGANDEQPHDTKEPRRPASARMRQPCTGDAALRSARGVRPPFPAGARRLIMPPRLGPGRGPPPPCCPQCGLRRFPRGPPPPPRGGVGGRNDPRGGMGGSNCPRGGMGGRNDPPRPFMGPRRHITGRGMPPRPGMWWVGRAPPPPRPGMGRGGMCGGYGRGRGHGERCFCHAMGSGGERPLPKPEGVVEPPPGRGVKGRGLELGPSPGHDQPSPAMSWAKPAARPKDEGSFAQPDRVSRSASAPNNLVGMLMNFPSHKDDVTATAASMQAESAVYPSAKPRNVETARTAASQIDYCPANIDRGGPMLEGGMLKGEPKAASPVISGSTRPEDSKAESPPPDAVGVPDRLQHEVTRSTTAPTSVGKDQRGSEATRTVADGSTDGLDGPQDVTRSNATTGPGAPRQRTTATTSGHADSEASTGVVYVDSPTAGSECEAPTKEAPIAEGHDGSRELSGPSEGGVAADRPAPPLSVEDVLKAALEGKCIVWAGGGAAAAPGGWLVAAITPGKLIPQKIDNSNVGFVQTEDHEEEPPEMATSCTQWEESDVQVALGEVPARTLPQLWANVKTPTAAVSDPIIVKAEDKPASEDPGTEKTAVKVGRRDWTYESQTKAPARGVSGREKGVLYPGVVGSGPEDRLTRSTMGTQTSVERDQDAVLGRVTRSTSGIQTDVERNRDTVVDGVEGGHSPTVSGETRTEETQTEDRLPGDRRWTPGCDHHEALPEVGRECSSAASGGAAELENPEADGTFPDRVLASSGEGTSGLATRGTTAKQSGDEGGGLDKLGQAVGPSFTLAPGTEGSTDTSVDRSTVTTDQLPAPTGTKTSSNKSHQPRKTPKEPTEWNSNQASDWQQQQSSMARGILSWALAQRRETDDQHDVSTDAAPGVSGPSGLDGGVPARALSPPQMAITEEEETVGDDVLAEKAPAANTLREGDRGGLDSPTQAACAEEVSTTAARTPSPSPADSSTSISSPVGGRRGVDLGVVLATKFSCQTKGSPSSNPTTHTVQAIPARKLLAGTPIAAPGVGTTRTTPPGQPGGSAGDGSVPQKVERGPKAEESLADPSGPGGRAFTNNSSEVTGIPKGDGRDEHRGKDDDHGGEDVEHAWKGDEHSRNGDEAGSSERVVVETKDTQTEDDIEVVVGKANTPQLLFRARPWATQLEHEFVPDDSAGESRVVRVRLQRRAREEGSSSSTLIESSTVLEGTLQLIIRDNG